MFTIKCKHTNTTKILNYSKDKVNYSNRTNARTGYTRDGQSEDKDTKAKTRNYDEYLKLHHKLRWFVNKQAWVWLSKKNLGNTTKLRQTRIKMKVILEIVDDNRRHAAQTHVWYKSSSPNNKIYHKTYGIYTSDSIFALTQRDIMLYRVFSKFQNLLS